MATEKQCKLMVERLDEKIKWLQGEIDYRRILKKKWRKILQDLKWTTKQKAHFLLDTDKKVAKYPSGGYAGEVAATVVFAKKKKA